MLLEIIGINLTATTTYRPNVVINSLIQPCKKENIYTKYNKNY